MNKRFWSKADVSLHGIGGPSPVATYHAKLSTMSLDSCVKDVPGPYRPAV